MVLVLYSLGRGRQRASARRERRFGDVSTVEEVANLPADVVASVKDGHGPGVLAYETDFFNVVWHTILMEGYHGIMIGNAGGTEAEGHTAPTQTIWILGVVGVFLAGLAFGITMLSGAVLVCTSHKSESNVTFPGCQS